MKKYMFKAKLENHTCYKDGIYPVTKVDFENQYVVAMSNNKRMSLFFNEIQLFFVIMVDGEERVVEYKQSICY